MWLRGDRRSAGVVRGSHQREGKELEAGQGQVANLVEPPAGGSPDFSQLAAYDRTLVATDYVSGMTDSFAVELYQRIRGISLP